MLEDHIANIAQLIGDKARAKILLALMSGKALTAGELSIRAEISPQTTSHHLNKLMAENLIRVETACRHRYYQLASHEVAAALESLSLLMPTSKIAPPRHHKLHPQICFARTCYDHCAGTLGVSLAKALQARGYLLLAEKYFTVTPSGKIFFDNLAIDNDILQRQKRPLALACLDWTEREYHVAGSLGKALLTYLLENRLILQSQKIPRAVILTTQGKLWFQKQFGIRF